MELQAQYLPTRFSHFKFNKQTIKRRNIFISHIKVVLLLILFSGKFSGQICDKKTSVYFEADKYSISDTENQKLEKLCKMFAQKTDTFMLEVYSFSDSIASVEYNYKLAGKRLKAIVNYLKKNSSAYFEIKEHVRGEELATASNATEEGRAKNRRVDVFYWKMRGDKITLKAKGGTEIDLDKNYFGSCGVCGSKPELSEVFTNEEAARKGISLQTTDGDNLITGGMMNLELNCPDEINRNKRKNWPCSDVVIRIPAASLDPEMGVWKVSKDSKTGAIKWEADEKGELEYDAKNKCYIMHANYCPGLGSMRSGINVDKRGGVSGNSTGRLPDSIGLIAVPELVRSRRNTNARAVGSGILYGNGVESANMWRFSYRTKGSVFFEDLGVAQNKIGYMFSGNIDRYEAECDSARMREKKCWCFDIPIEAYDKIIYFKKKKEIRLKVPFKYRDYAVRLFIPAADTLLPLKRVKNSARKYVFKEPLPDTYVVVYGDDAKASDKRAYDGHVFLGEIKIKFNKRHTYYKAKLKKRQVRKAIAENS